MELSTLTWLVVGTTFVLYIGIAIWSRARATGEFYVAGRGVDEKPPLSEFRENEFNEVVGIR